MSAINPWTEPHWKTAVQTAKKARAKRTRRLKRAEKAHKAEVRFRDRGCRFPLCGCHIVGGMKAILTVSHLVHKGMGGDPTGDRSTADKMILLCKWRHQDAFISRDKGTMRWEPLTDAGSNGPVRWLIDRASFVFGVPLQRGAEDWRVVAIETDVRVWYPPSDWAFVMLEELAKMKR